MQTQNMKKRLLNVITVGVLVFNMILLTTFGTKAANNTSVFDDIEDVIIEMLPILILIVVCGVMIGTLRRATS